MKTFIFGDSHGTGVELKELLDIMSPSSADRVVSVGDAFDRGYAAGMVWELIQKYNIEVFMGNHEYKMMHYLQGERDHLPPSYYVAMNILMAHVEPGEFLAWLEKRPLLRDYGEFIVTHAAVDVENPLRENVSWNVYGNMPEPMVRPAAGDGKEYFWDKWDGDKIVIYGHLVTGDNLPRIRRNKRGKVNSIGLDTAAVHGGKLTGYCPEDNKFYSYGNGIDYGGMLKANIKLNGGVTLNEGWLKFAISQREAVRARIDREKAEKAQAADALASSGTQVLG